MEKVTDTAELSDEAVTCRSEAHDWPKRVPYQWSKRVRGKVVECTREYVCRTCGAVKTITYDIIMGLPSPRGSKMDYSNVSAYLAKGRRISRSEAMAEEIKRQYPKVRLG